MITARHGIKMHRNVLFDLLSGGFSLWNSKKERR